MKLFTRYSRITVLTTIIIFLIASAAYFFTLHFVLIRQIDEDLRIEEHEILAYVRQHDRIPENMSVRDQLINYEQVVSSFTKRYFSTTRTGSGHEKEKEEYRQLFFGVDAAGKSYKVTVSKSLEETDDIIRSVLLITFTTILAILLVSFIINRVVLGRIWKPFYQSLSAVKQFKISGDQPLRLPASGIEEFGFMNQTLERITRQAQLDYLSLKTFSENASHEIQTPIAIIRSKLDLLIQDEHLSNEQSQAVERAYVAVQKLTHLNQSLLLLAKIENNQFEEVEQVNMKNKLKDKLSDFQDLWQAHMIRVEAQLEDVTVQMNAQLADILLNNLLSNATKYNYEGGSITILLKQEILSITNSSHENGLDQGKIFQRFYKASQSTEHNGLGLSIIRQICEASGCTVSYAFTQGNHSFTVGWKTS
ncbi:MAG TPA: HAMP domain-containing sensor histidine kinase [Flavisolibacter sp.]|nr:HAMP domain-containing sensor histidine kinase [Flavisolibacter sp.]